MSEKWFCAVQINLKQKSNLNIVVKYLLHKIGWLAYISFSNILLMHLIVEQQVKRISAAKPPLGSIIIELVYHIIIRKFLLWHSPKIQVNSGVPWKHGDMKDIIGMNTQQKKIRNTAHPSNKTENTISFFSCNSNDSIFKSIERLLTEKNDDCVKKLTNVMRCSIVNQKRDWSTYFHN